MAPLEREPCPAHRSGRPRRPTPSYRVPPPGGGRRRADRLLTPIPPWMISGSWARSRTARKSRPGPGRSSGASVAREKVKTNRPAPGQATRAASAIARRISAAERARFQMPCASTRAALASRSGMASMGTQASQTRPPPRGLEHGPGQVRGKDAGAERRHRRRSRRSTTLNPGRRASWPATDMATGVPRAEMRCRGENARRPPARTARISRRPTVPRVIRAGRRLGVVVSDHPRSRDWAEPGLGHLPAEPILATAVWHRSCL
jgi:hypothetical protein